MSRKIILGLAACCIGAMHFVAPLAAQGNTTRQVHAAALQWVIDSVVLKQSISLSALCFSSGRLRQLNGALAMLTPDGDLDSLTIAAIPLVRVPMRAGTGCVTSTVSPLPTIDKITNQQAAALLVGPVVMDSAGHATVQAEYRVNGRWGAGYNCTVVSRAGGWVVEQCKMLWIS